MRRHEQDEVKQAVVRAALDYVLEGQLLRVGAESTAPLSIEELGEIKDRIGGAVAWSEDNKMRLEGHGIKALGAVLVPWQKSLGYPGAFCGTTIAAASTIDILMPPSISLILYAPVPFYAVGLIVLGLITYVPALTLHL